MSNEFNWKFEDEIESVDEQSPNDFNTNSSKESKNKKCKKRAKKVLTEEEIIIKKEKQRKTLKICFLTIATIGLLVVIVLFSVFIIHPFAEYKIAENAYNNSDFEKAVNIYTKLEDYRDSKDRVIDSKYKYGCELSESGDFEKSYNIFSFLIYQDETNTNYKKYYIYSGYNYARMLYDKDDFDSIVTIIRNISNYSGVDSADDLYIDPSKIAELKSDTYYSLFLKAYNNKDYKSALSYYTGCNRSKKNKKYQDCLFQHTLEMISDGDYTNIDNNLKKLSISDSQKSEIKKAKYSYVKNHYNNEDLATYSYLKDLKKSKYKDSGSLYKKLYKISVSIKFNDDENSTSSSYSSMSKYSTIYCHIFKTGGTPFGQEKIKCKFIWPDGSTNTVNSTYGLWADETVVYFWYNEPYYGATGTARLNVYDSDGKLVGSSTVTLTN